MQATTSAKKKFLPTLQELKNNKWRIVGSLICIAASIVSLKYWQHIEHERKASILRMRRQTESEFSRQAALSDASLAVSAATPSQVSE